MSANVINAHRTDAVPCPRRDAAAGLVNHVPALISLRLRAPAGSTEVSICSGVTTSGDLA